MVDTLPTFDEDYGSEGDGDGAAGGSPEGDESGQGGGGTGDAAIMLAQQLTDQAETGAGEVVYLDISTAARQVAEARAAARGLWPLPRVGVINGMSQASAALMDLPYAPVEGSEFDSD